MDCLLLPGAIHMVRHEKKKMYIKSDFKAFFKPATNGQSDKGFLLTSKVCPQGVVCPCLGAIYIYKIIKNVYQNQISSFRLATNGQRNKGFLLTSTFDPKGLSVPALGLYTCIKAFKYIPAPGVR